MRPIFASVIVVAALALVVVVAVLIRIDRPPPPASSRRGVPEQAGRGAPKRSEAGSSGADRMTRSERVARRLERLREEYEARRQDAPTPPPVRAGQGVELPTARAYARLGAGRHPAPHAPSGAGSEAAEVAELEAIALTDPDPDERVGAIFFLSASDDPRVIPVLVQALGDPDSEVRLAAVEALGDFEEQLSPAQLSPALHDPDPEVRFEAVSILGDIETPEAEQMVRSATNDPDEDVRTLAEGILEITGN